MAIPEDNKDAAALVPEIGIPVVLVTKASPFTPLGKTFLEEFPRFACTHRSRVASPSRFWRVRHLARAGAVESCSQTALPGLANEAVDALLHFPQRLAPPPSSAGHRRHDEVGAGRGKQRRGPGSRGGARLEREHRPSRQQARRCAGWQPGLAARPAALRACIFAACVLPPARLLPRLLAVHFQAQVSPSEQRHPSACPSPAASPSQLARPRVPPPLPGWSGSCGSRRRTHAAAPATPPAPSSPASRRRRSRWSRCKEAARPTPGGSVPWLGQAAGRTAAGRGSRSPHMLQTFSRHACIASTPHYLMRGNLSQRRTPSRSAAAGGLCPVHAAHHAQGLLPLVAPHRVRPHLHPPPAVLRGERCTAAVRGAVQRSAGTRRGCSQSCAVLCCAAGGRAGCRVCPFPQPATAVRCGSRAA